MARITAFLRQFDWLMFGSLCILISLGLALLYSVDINREGGELATFWKQLVIAGGGMFIFFVVSAIDFHTWEGLSRPLYVVMLFILVAVLLFGQTVNATKGWLDIGGFRFQPVEFAKTVIVVTLAAFFARRSRALDRLPNLLQSMVLVGGIVGLVLLQPDFGSSMVIFAVWASLLFIIGVRREYLVAMLVAGLCLFLLSWLFIFKPYQKDRLLTFFFPNEKAQSQSYNVRQAIIAVGAGELRGRGLGEGSQSQLRFLPESTTDFMFATLGEQLGFAGVSLLIFLLGVLYYRLLRLLSLCQDGFASFLVLGTTLLFTIEIFVNAGMNMGLVPVVGIPFPFLSAGGSTLLAHLILFGMVENVAHFEGSRGYQLSSARAL